MTSATKTAHRAPARMGFAPTHTRTIAVLSATAAALAVWTLASPVLGVDLQVQRQPGQLEAVSAAEVLLSSLVVSLAGWASLAILERFTTRAGRVWTVLALLVLTLSMAGPLAGGTTTAGKVALALMHLTVAAVLIPALQRSSTVRTPR